MAKPISGTNGVDTLSGLNGSSKLVGGNGDDIYIIDDVGDEVVERKNGGTDHLMAYISYQLPGEVENLTLLGTDNLWGAGNELDNVIIGNSGANDLYGHGGNDRLFGGNGDDTLIGGSGSDLLDGGAGADVAIFAGLSTDYSFEWEGDLLRVTLLTGAGAEDTDQVTGVEYLQFDDMIIETTGVVQTSAAVNQPPVADDDLAATLEDTSVIIDVLANDTDPDGDVLSVSSLGSASHGTVAINADGTLTYTPNANYYGADSFSYTISDGNGNSATASVTLEIGAVNDEPIAVDDVASATAGQTFTSTVAVLANDDDPDGDVLAVGTCDTVSAMGGTVSMNADGSYSYTPAAGFVGTDSFSYSVSDGKGGSATADVTLTVEASNEVLNYQLPDYVLPALLPDGSGDTFNRWNRDDPLGSPVTITYTFLQEVPDYYSESAEERTDFQPFTTEQEAAARQALALIESFTNITFLETTDSVGLITFGMADLPGGAGWAYMPSSLSLKGGDVWLDSTVADNHDLTLGGDGFKNLLHEIGHALGLKHPNEGETLPQDEMSRKYTVMAYAQHPDMVGAEPWNYMPYDMAALQHLYGRNTSNTAGDDVYDVSNVDGLLTTIWDAGGWDVLAASGSTGPVVLDLNPGSYSTSGTSYGWYPATDNIALAYGTIIEEARGGNGDDVIIGNTSDNLLSGGAGADQFVFAADWGTDVIKDFEDGIDIIDLSPLPLGFADLEIADLGGSAMIDFEGNQIVLEGVPVSLVDPSDFLFGAIA